jgi:hypothetical protein
LLFTNYPHHSSHVQSRSLRSSFTSILYRKQFRSLRDSASRQCHPLWGMCLSMA